MNSLLAHSLVKIQSDCKIIFNKILLMYLKLLIQEIKLNKTKMNKNNFLSN